MPSDHPAHLWASLPLALVYKLSQNTGDTFTTWWGVIPENKPCSTAKNLITHIFFDVLWFHSFVRIIRGVKSAKYKPAKKQTNKKCIKLISRHRERFFFSCLLNVFLARAKSVRIWFKLECTKYSTGVILHHWIQRNYCQWQKWRAGIQADFPFAIVSIYVPCELHTKQKQTEEATPFSKGN